MARSIWHDSVRRGDLNVSTNSDAPNRWEGLDVPEIRGFVVPSATKGGVIYRCRLTRFGEIYMQADSWHTNGRGYALIADAIADVLAGGW
jgi:hypothetical protein